MKSLFKPTCLFFALLVSFSLSACSSNESPSEPVSDSSVTTNTIEEPSSVEESAPVNDVIEEVIIEEVQQKEPEESSEWGWSPVAELEGMDVCGLVYAWRPYKMDWSAFDYAPVDDRYYVVNKDDKYGLIDINRNWIANPEYAQVEYAYNYYISTGFEWDSPFYTLSEGELVACDPDDSPSIIGSGLDPAMCWNDETNSFIIISEMSDYIFDANFKYEGTVACTKYKSGQYILGVITNNTPVTDFIYEGGTTYSDGLIAVKKDGKWGYLNAEGETVIPFEYDGIRTYDYGYEYEVKDLETSSPGIYSAESLENMVNQWRDFFFGATCTDGYVVLCKDGEYGLYTNAYEEVVPLGTFEVISEVTDGHFYAKKDGTWGICELP